MNLLLPFRKASSQIDYEILAITIAFENSQVIEKQSSNLNEAMRLKMDLNW